MLLLSLDLVGTISQAQQDESASPNTGKITGRVINDNGEPIAHAAVSVFANGQQPRLTTTDDAGNFELLGLDPVAYSVYASAPAHITPPREPDSLPAAYRTGDAVTITLTKGAVITGTVTSPAGEPLVQASVRAILIRDVNGKPPANVRYPTEKSTDDRGVYRIYGLVAGTYLVSAGGRGTYGYTTNAYESDSPTFAPSSARDTAAEIVVGAGEEVSGVDIRFRGESGHMVSGTLTGGAGPNGSTNIILTQMVDGSTQVSAATFQSPEGKGFSFYGIADGEYDVSAQSSSMQGDALTSEPVHLTVKGSDISGVSVVLKALASVNGKVVLESSARPECGNKRKPLLSETLVLARVNRNAQTSQPTPLSFSNSQSPPDKSGEFTLRNLSAGQFSLNAIFFAKYWYLRSINRTAAVVAAPGKGAGANRQTDLAKEGITLKAGERVSGVTLTLAEGAASLLGSVKLPAGSSIPPKLYVHLVPAEKEHAENVLRFFTASVVADGSFEFHNLAPGKYWILARLSPDNEPEFDSRLRAPAAADQRALLQHAAELAKSEMELRPCQNVTDYQIPFEISAPHN